jgi:NTP pyrophosphatase (non-canonical NTP hydrolase)
MNKIIEELNNMTWTRDKRYTKECEILASLALQQLNLEKNVKKGDFEDMHLYHEHTWCITELLEEEINELMDELTQSGFTNTVLKSKINYQRAREELGDVAACLVGLLAKLNKMESKE